MAAGSSDTVFVEGVMMAVLRASGGPGLLELCERASSRGVDSLAARAMLFRARALRDAGRTSEAWRAYTGFATAHPSHPSAHEAAFLAGRYYDSELMWPEAAAAYSAALGASGVGRYDESSYWRGGFSLLADGRPGEALPLWEEGCERFPWGFWHDEMMYWRARTAGWNAPGSSVLLQEAAETHPWEYYGMRAAARLGRDPSWSPPFPAVEVPPLAIDLVSRGYARLAGSMLRHASTPDTLERVQALGLLGMHPEAISLCGALDSRLRYSGAGTVPEAAAVFQFPAPYRELAGSACSGLSLPPALVMGIIREESSFDREARSSAGARGLIQLMPGTASDVARWYGLPALQGDDFHDPGSSVRYGSLYIDRQWGAFAGELPLVLAAYNAGPGNASRWRDLLTYQSGDADWFTERITFRETREYVKRVTRSSWIYGRFFQ
jgi:soluble lytic murein transglycosylase-like protein